MFASKLHEVRKSLLYIIARIIDQFSAKSDRKCAKFRHISSFRNMIELDIPMSRP